MTTQPAHAPSLVTGVSSAPDSELNQAKILKRARELLPSIDEDTLSSVGQNFRPEDEPGQTLGRAYATGPRGENLSQTEFASAYVRCAKNIVDAARTILESSGSAKELAERREALEQSLPGKYPSGPVLSEADAQVRYEQLTRTEIVRLSGAGPADPELQYRAVHLASIVAARAQQTLDLEQLLEQKKDRLAELQSLMKEARDRAGAKAGPVEIMQQYVELVVDRHHRVPRLVAFSDFDGYLTKIPESGSRWKPGERTNSVVNNVDRVAGELPMFLRLVTTECPGLDGTRRELADRLYISAARSSEYFNDAPALLRVLSASSITHQILTGNHSRYL